MNRKELLVFGAEKFGKKQTEIDKALNLAFDVIESALEEGNDVKLTRVIGFEIVDVKTRVVRNPQNGQEFMLTPHKKVKVKLGKKLAKKYEAD